jgi:hypothetical protein
MRGPRRSRSCSSRQRPPLRRAEPPASSSPCCSPASSRAVPHRARFCILCSTSASPPHLDTAASPSCPGTQGESPPFTLLWTQPSSRGWTEPCELADGVLPAACSRHHADPPTLESWPSSRAGRLQVPLPSSPRALLCLAVVSFHCSTCVAELWFATGTHTLSTPPSSQGPAFLWPGVM